MSVYLDHFYIKPTKDSYDKLKDVFKNIIGEDLFQYGEHEDDGKKWGGFYIHFEKGTFLEVLDPTLCDTSQSIGICMTCAKEYRGHFLGQIRDILSEQGKEFELEFVPIEDPDLSICRARPLQYLSAWGVEYTDRWLKEWGSNISKMGMLSPFESLQSASFVFSEGHVQELKDNLSWIDERLLNESPVALPLQSGTTTSVSFIEGKIPSCSLSFVVDEDCTPIDIKGDNFSLLIRDGIASLTTKLSI